MTGKNTFFEMMSLPKSSADIELEQLKLQELALKRKRPWLYRYKMYQWSREFFESREKINLLCAANQLGKSSIQIRKCIEWATNRELWPLLWMQEPTQFWYMYPTSKQAEVEFETKWKQFLPPQDDPDYGWKLERKNKEIFCLRFKKFPVGIYFKYYSQSTTALQTGTVDALFCDEEVPMEHYNELMFRISASNGYFHMVFTATIGQEFWRLCMEPGKDEKEELPTAKKWVVSLYDSMRYEDGSASPWTMEKIKMVEMKCSSDLEIQKRVMGRFVLDDVAARIYFQYDPKRHFIKGHPIPESWLYYAGVDIGSGASETAHPAAIAFIAVSPDFRKARVVKAWRGDGTPTTVSDIVKKFIEMKKELGKPIVAQYYDWASADFYPIATDMGESQFQRADKGEKGVEKVNVLFKNDMLMLHDSDPEVGKLSTEYLKVRHSSNKNKRKDDLADAVRYGLSNIPFDFSGLIGKTSSYTENKMVELTQDQRDTAMRRGLIPDDEKWRVEAQDRLNEELREWNELYG